MTFGQNIRKLREAKGITLRAFAGKCGISPTYQSKIERGEFPEPSAERIKMMADLLNVDGDLLALQSGKIPNWIKALLKDDAEVCLKALEDIAKLKEQEE